jgi:hypothetical protein
MIEKAQAIAEQAIEFAREKPHVAVGIAFGVGWVLGNGLHPRVVLSAARLGWRAVIGGALGAGGIAGILSQAGVEGREAHATRGTPPKRTAGEHSPSQKTRTETT